MNTFALLLRLSTGWFVVSAGLAGAVLLAGPEALRLLGDLGGAARTPFDRLLVEGCSVAAVVATGRLWWVTTEVAFLVVRDRPVTARSGPLRSVALAACGVLALTAGPAAASTDARVDQDPAGRQASLAGLPLPDRATGGVGHPEREPLERRRIRGGWLTVAPGDSLWSLAEAQVGPHASVAEVASYWLRLSADNAERVAPDPDLIHPGLRLHRPSTRP